jgi:hypothetical protein
VLRVGSGNGLGRREPRQIWDASEFLWRKHGGTGVIVIFDRVRDAPIAHEPSCAHVTEERFRQKIVEMDGKNGRYWWFEKFSDAERLIAARRCGHCG